MVTEQRRAWIEPHLATIRVGAAGTEGGWKGGLGGHFFYFCKGKLCFFNFDIILYKTFSINIISNTFHVEVTKSNQVFVLWNVCQNLFGQMFLYQSILLEILNAWYSHSVYFTNLYFHIFCKFEFIFSNSFLYGSNSFLNKA